MPRSNPRAQWSSRADFDFTDPERCCARLLRCSEDQYAPGCWLSNVARCRGDRGSNDLSPADWSVSSPFNDNAVEEHKEQFAVVLDAAQLGGIGLSVGVV